MAIITKKDFEVKMYSAYIDNVTGFVHDLKELMGNEFYLVYKGIMFLKSELNILHPKVIMLYNFIYEDHGFERVETTTGNPLISVNQEFNIIKTGLNVL